MAKQGMSKRWINVTMHQLMTFFRANGFKKQRELELERQYLPVRYRKRSEYIPLQLKTAYPPIRTIYASASASDEPWRGMASLP
jgi:hypothetical protein